MHSSSLPVPQCCKAAAWHWSFYRPKMQVGVTAVRQSQKYFDHHVNHITVAAQATNQPEYWLLIGSSNNNAQVN